MNKNRKKRKQKELFSKKKQEIKSNNVNKILKSCLITNKTNKYREYLNCTCDNVESLEEVHHIIEKGIDVLDAFKSGVGLAAPQIGFLKNIIFINSTKRKKEDTQVLINPIVVSHSSDARYEEEGCLSYPGISRKIERWETITVEYLNNFNFEKGVANFSGFEARVVQHEIDHLMGICAVGEEGYATIESREQYYVRHPYYKEI